MELMVFVFLGCMITATIMFIAVGLAFCLKAIEEDEDSEYFVNK